MIAYEDDYVDIDSQAQKCRSLVNPEMITNPAFDDVILAMISAVCSDGYNDPPKHLKKTISDDRKEITISSYTRENKQDSHWFSYNKASIKLTSDGDLYFYVSKNKAVNLAEYERGLLGLYVTPNDLPYSSYEYQTVYFIDHCFHVFNRLGIETAFSEYKDTCPRSDNNFDSLIDESNKHCPTSWNINDYPASIPPGVQEYKPFRTYWSRFPNRFGIVYMHEKDDTDEKVSIWTSNINHPNQLYPSKPIAYSSDGVIKVIPEYSDQQSPEQDLNTLLYRLNRDYIENLEKQPDRNNILLINSLNSAKGDLLCKNDDIGQRRDF